MLSSDIHGHKYTYGTKTYMQAKHPYMYFFLIKIMSIKINEYLLCHFYLLSYQKLDPGHTFLI